MEWKSIESAPKDGDDYLICNFWDQIHVGYWCGLDECWLESAYVAINEPTHWMELPEPPKKED